MAGGVRVRADGVQTGGETERVWKRGELGLGTGRPVARDGERAQMDGAARQRSSAVFSRENDLLIAGWGAGRGWCLHESRSTLSHPIMRCGVLRLCPPPPLGIVAAHWRRRRDDLQSLF